MIIILIATFLVSAQLVEMEYITSKLRKAIPFTELIGRYEVLSDVQKRAVSAIIGASVADSATRPFHWLYDTKKLKDVVGNTVPEFWHENCSPFYSMPTGGRSCYNDEAIATLSSLSEDQSIAVELNDINKSFLELFSPESDYAIAFKARAEAYDPAKRLEERKPVPGPWQQKAVTSFLERYAAGNQETGADDSNESDGFCVSFPLAARLAVFSENEAEAAEAVRQTAMILSTNASAIAHSLVCCSALRAAIRTGDFAAALASASANHPEINAEYEEVLAAVARAADHVEAVNEFGKACGHPGNFKSGVLALLSSDSFVEGVRKNILAGGCNCSRANFIGACLGAKYGLGGESGIPVEWISKTSEGELIFALALSRVACAPIE